jgi:hypothetical protein
MKPNTKSTSRTFCSSTRIRSVWALQIAISENLKNDTYFNKKFASLTLGKERSGYSGGEKD